MSDVQCTSSSDAPAGAEESPCRSLSDRQLADFGRWYDKFYQRACRLATKLVDELDAGDVVQTAVIKLMAACTRAKEPYLFPDTEDGFRRLLFTIVVNVARDYVRSSADSKRSTIPRPQDAEPLLGRWNVPDRSLSFDTQRIARDDDDAYKEDEGPVVPMPRRLVYDAPPDEARMRFEEFAHHVYKSLEPLAQMQIHVIYATYYLGLDRAECAAYLNISPKTVDTHRARAFARLRRIIPDWQAADAYDDNRWRDWIHAMDQRWLEEHPGELPGGSPPPPQRRAA